MGGIAQVSLTMTNTGTEAVRVQLKTITQQDKKRISRGPYYALLQGGQSKYRSFSVPVTAGKSFAVQLSDSDGNPLACKGLKLAE